MINYACYLTQFITITHIFRSSITSRVIYKWSVSNFYYRYSGNHELAACSDPQRRQHVLCRSPFNLLSWRTSHSDRVHYLQNGVHISESSIRYSRLKPRLLLPTLRECSLVEAYIKDYSIKIL